MTEWVDCPLCGSIHCQKEDGVITCTNLQCPSNVGMPDVEHNFFIVVSPNEKTTYWQASLAFSEKDAKRKFIESVIMTPDGLYVDDSTIYSLFRSYEKVGFHVKWLNNN